MGEEEVSVRWDRREDALSRGLLELLTTGDGADVTLACQGQYVKAHKNILSVCSPYFRALFNANPCQHPIVILQEARVSHMKALLQFMYCGETSVPQQELAAFLRTAETLRIRGLTQSCDQACNTGQCSAGSADPSCSPCEHQQQHQQPDVPPAYTTECCDIKQEPIDEIIVADEEEEISQKCSLTISDCVSLATADAAPSLSKDSVSPPSSNCSSPTPRRGRSDPQVESLLRGWGLPGAVAVFQDNKGPQHTKKSTITGAASDKPPYKRIFNILDSDESDTEVDQMRTSVKVDETSSASQSSGQHSSPAPATPSALTGIEEPVDEQMDADDLDNSISQAKNKSKAKSARTIRLESETRPYNFQGPEVFLRKGSKIHLANNVWVDYENWKVIKGEANHHTFASKLLSSMYATPDLVKRSWSGKPSPRSQETGALTIPLSPVTKKTLLYEEINMASFLRLTSTEIINLFPNVRERLEFKVLHQTYLESSLSEPSTSQQDAGDVNQPSFDTTAAQPARKRRRNDAPSPQNAAGSNLNPSPPQQKSRTTAPGTEGDLGPWEFTQFQPSVAIDKMVMEKLNNWGFESLIPKFVAHHINFSTFLRLNDQMIQRLIIKPGQRIGFMIIYREFLKTNHPHEFKKAFPDNSDLVFRFPQGPMKLVLEPQKEETALSVSASHNKEGVVTPPQATGATRHPPGSRVTAKPPPRTAKPHPLRKVKPPPITVKPPPSIIVTRGRGRPRKIYREEDSTSDTASETESEYASSPAEDSDDVQVLIEF